MKFLSLLKNTKIVTRSWPSCHQQPRTLSFKALANTNNNNDMFKTINSAYNIDPTTMEEEVIEESPELSLFTDQSFECASFSSASEDDSRGVDPIESVIRDLRSDRLFFEPDETSSIFEAKANCCGAILPFKDSVLMFMDSKDPFVDFKKSMEEMVEAHGVKDWEGLEELLCWYLKVNGKSNHGYIVGAFVDLLVGLAFANSSNDSSSPTISSSHDSPPSSSPLSCYSTFQSSSCSTHCVSCIEGEGEGHIPSPSSSLLLKQVKEEITHEDIEASSSSRNA